MTVQNKKPRSLLEAAFIKYGIEVMTVARLTGTNKMRIAGSSAASLLPRVLSASES